MELNQNTMQNIKDEIHLTQMKMRGQIHVSQYQNYLWIGDQTIDECETI